MGVEQLSMYGYASKAEVLADARRYWNPDKTSFWQDEGVPLVVGDRSGYRLTDVDGHEVIDVHLNGGTYNLGHRNPELVDTLTHAIRHLDIGNHHFPTPGRAALARQLVEATPGADKVVFGSSGAEAVDVALKSARYATGRRRIVSVVKAYHGHTGLAVATGDARFSQLFHSDNPAEFAQVPFNDLGAMETALADRDTAAVIMETVPATYGFPLPEPGFLAGVKQACEATGTLYIADEVQTGLGRTGDLWAIHGEGVTPDILVTGKGLGGGLYPISATLLGPTASGWLQRDGFAHMATFGGAELGCAVAANVLEITQRSETRDNVRRRISQITEGLTRLRAGRDVLLTGRAVPEAVVEKFRAEVTRERQMVQALALDSGLPDSAERLALAASSSLGGLDVLCLNAGIFPNKPLAELTYADVREVFAVNVESQMLALAACLPLLRESAAGRVVLTSSITGPVTGFPGWSHYAASKAAQLGFMRTAALELAPYGITVNAVAPGNVATEGLDGMGEDYLAPTTATIPLGRLARPQEIADAVEFLAGERASFVTGQVLTVDGGQTLPESPEAVLPARATP